MKTQIHFSPEQIPEVREPMSLLRLGAPVITPKECFEKIVRTIAPKAELKEGDSGARAAYDGKRLVAFANPKTGETNIFPSLENLKPGRGSAGRAKAVSERLLKDTTLFPKDGTELSPRAPITLVASNHSRDGKRTAPAEYLSYVRIERKVNGLPVFGPGTRAMVAVAHDDTIHALSHRWRSAHPNGEKVKPHSRAEIAKAILAQLSTCAKHAVVRVDKVILGYYDGGMNLLQPVYRFHATLIAPDKKIHAANSHVFGHVSIGEAPEPLPVLGIQEGKSPEEPGAHRKSEKTSRTPSPRDPTVGRYVVRQDNPGWVNSANGFFANLEAAGVFASFLGRSPIPFTNSQYYWAEPRLFLSEKDSFVNSVQIALNEVHGNWGLFSTLKNDADFVELSNIPSSGYGGGGGGSLAYWILHSCEVIPTQTDESTSFNVWWSIFNGLHAVLGYRTEMWINDGVTSPFGLSIGLGAPMVSAWLNAVVSDDSYGAGDATYQDGNFNPTKLEPMGRASAIAVCGHGDDTASDVAPLPPATCLTEWWFNN